ncbi:MAG: hypothetical protein AABX04_05020 [Nanoarchaeota archaeon]
MEKIRNKGMEWTINDYNDRLGKENDLLDENDKERVKFDEEERRKIKEIWKK